MGKETLALATSRATDCGRLPSLAAPLCSSLSCHLLSARYLPQGCSKLWQRLTQQSLGTIESGHVEVGMVTGHNGITFISLFIINVTNVRNVPMLGECMKLADQY